MLEPPPSDAVVVKDFVIWHCYVNIVNSLFLYFVKKRLS
jgi:hypothetical protein